jgi:hypothetical protein
LNTFLAPLASDTVTTILGFTEIDRPGRLYMRSRTISLTTRLAKELEAIAAQTPKRPDDLVSVFMTM